MKLFEEGVELEYYSGIAEEFVDIPTVIELAKRFKQGFEIRIKLQPKKVVLYGADYEGWEFGEEKEFRDTHTLTFEVDENGKPILGTEKLEEIK